MVRAGNTRTPTGRLNPEGESSGGPLVSARLSSCGGTLGIKSPRRLSRSRIGIIFVGVRKILVPSKSKRLPELIRGRGWGTSPPTIFPGDAGFGESHEAHRTCYSALGLSLVLLVNKLRLANLDRLSEVILLEAMGG